MNFSILRDINDSMLANTQQEQNLIEHLVVTGVLGAGIAKSVGISKEHQDAVLLSGLLHDCGKAMPFIQKYFSDPSDKKSFFYDLRHHEISWTIFLQSRNIIEEILNIQSDIRSDCIENAIFYHHARALYEGKKTKALIENSDDVFLKLNDLNMIHEYNNVLIPFAKNILDSFIFLLGKKKTSLSIREMAPKTSPIPSLFQTTNLKDHLESLTDTNALMHIYRSCLINADRLVSSLPSPLLNSYFETILSLTSDKITDFGNSLYLDLKQEISRPRTLFGQFNTISQGLAQDKRTQSQLEIAKKCSEKTISICGAPAGYGKSRIALLWAIKNLEPSEKILWVVPRNDIALSLGREIPLELSALIGPNNISIEVFLTGERVSDQGANISSDIPEFDADIIITNIDNLLNPYTKHNIANRIIDIHTSIIVFDEWHEFYTDEPMFYVFIQLLYGRNIFSHAKTLLLSATPLPINRFWDRGEFITGDAGIIKHWHNKKITPHYIESSREIPMHGGCCVVFNSISETVNFAKMHGNKKIKYVIHSKFIKEHRKNLIDNIICDFGRGKKNNIDNISSCLIIQASLNISFQYMTDSILGPLKTVQILGRTDRFNEFDEPHIYFFDFKESDSEKSAIQTLFSVDLRKKWATLLFDFTQKGPFEYNNIYELYRQFFEDNKDEFTKWIDSILLKSLKNTESLPPLFPSHKDLELGSDKKDIKLLKILPKGNLRQSLGSYFVSYYWKQGERFLTEDDLFTIGKHEADNVVKYLHSEEFRSSGDSKIYNDSRYVGHFRYPIQKGKKFDINNHSEKEILKMARNQLSPLIDTRKIYDSFYGLYKIKTDQ